MKSVFEHVGMHLCFTIRDHGDEGVGYIFTVTCLISVLKSYAVEVTKNYLLFF